jgi:hypothetical protein
VNPEPDAPTRDQPRLVALALVLALVAGVFSLVTGYRGRELSVFDEATHADYAYQVAHGHIPHRGSVLAPVIREEWSCRGAYRKLVKLPDCHAPDKPPAKYPAGGQDYNFGHPPLYYAITGVTARALDVVVPGRHFILLARAVGALWLYAAMLVLMLAMIRLGCRWTYAFAGALLLPLSPLVLHASSAVTNDATAALCGAVGLWLLTRVIVDRNLGWVVPAIATALMTATKVLNALPALFLALVLLVLALWQRKHPEDEDDSPGALPRLELGSTLRLVAALVVPFLVVFVGWQLFQSGRGPSDWASPIKGISSHPIQGLPFDEVLSTSFAGYFPGMGYYLPGQIARPSLDAWGRLLNLLLVSAPLLAMAISRTRSRTWFVGAMALTGITLFPLAVELQAVAQDYEYFPAVISRYGMSLLPWLIGALGLVAQRKRLIKTTLAITAYGFLVVLYAVLQ